MWRKIKRPDKRDSKNLVGLRTVNEGKGFDELRKEREESSPVDLREGQPRQGRSSNYERMQVLWKHADAMLMMR